MTIFHPQSDDEPSIIVHSTKIFVVSPIKAAHQRQFDEAFAVIVSVMVRLSLPLV